MGSHVEVGAVISDLESEYERSKKFLDELYRSLEGGRIAPSDRVGVVRPAGSDGSADKELQGCAVADPFAAYELQDEDSDLSNCSDSSTSVLRLPELRQDGRSPNCLQPSAQRSSIHRREEIPAAVPKRKTSINGVSKKQPNIHVSCPILEYPPVDDTTPQSASLGGGLDGYLQRRYSNAQVAPTGFGSLDPVHLAQMLTPSPPPVPTGRHRRSSLDFIPAPPAHLRKLVDNNFLASSPTPAATGFGGQEVPSHSKPQPPSQPSKQPRSLEVLGNSASGNALTPTQPPTTSRPPAAGVPSPYRRSSMRLQSSSGAAPQHGPHAQAGNQEVHHLTLSLDSPTPPSVAVAGVAAHLTRTHVDFSGPQATGGLSSPRGNSSPNLLPPLQLGLGSTGALALTGSKSVHSSIEFLPVTGTHPGRCGSWSGAPPPGAAAATAAACAPPADTCNEQSPRERLRTMRFSRCGPVACVNLPSPTGAAGGGGGSGGGGISPAGGAAPGVALVPTPPSAPAPVRDRDRRTLTSGEVPERAVPRASSLLTATMLRAAPHRGSSCGMGGSATHDGSGAGSAGGAERLTGSGEAVGDPAAALLEAAGVSTVVGSPHPTFSVLQLHQQPYAHHHQHLQHQHHAAGRAELRIRSVGGAQAH